MNVENHLVRIVEEQKSGVPKGICSVCSANRYVVDAALLQGLEDGSSVLIEATCNQVNQFGGYTGMTPQDFQGFVSAKAEHYGLPHHRLILGGDHLGPYPFRKETEERAMEKTRDLIKAFVHAGYVKLHIDTSHRLANDPGDEDEALSPSIVATRCAMLCAEAEKAFSEYKEEVPDAVSPVYIIGTEVPSPGGSEQTEPYGHITRVEDLEETIDLCKKAFHLYRIDHAWERVIAVVVEPGVEHGDAKVLEYRREETRTLSEAIRRYDSLVFEAHTTDYQTVHALKAMVEDGFAILKTGQSQTFTAREAVFMLSCIEGELLPYHRGMRPSRFLETLDRVMTAEPGYWQGFYNRDDSSFQRKYSFYDRQRYYWNNLSVEVSLHTLISNLRGTEVPLSLLSQFMPEQYRKIRAGVLQNDPEDLIRDRIMDHLREYAYAVGNRNTLFDWWVRK
jgi:D-tagatose-1,6-bisphosphate aldolase subunit GatZ/KbaZ